MKLKIKPSAKIKRRYVLLDADSKEEVEKAVLDYIGILGWTKAGIVFVKIKNKYNDKIVLSVDRKEIDDIRAAFELCDFKIKVLRVSGTLRGLEDRNL